MRNGEVEQIGDQMRNVGEELKVQSGDAGGCRGGRSHLFAWRPTVGIETLGEDSSRWG